MTLIVAAVLTLLVGLAPATTTTASGATFIYDAQSNARVDAQAFGRVKVSSTQVSELREWSASPSVEAQGNLVTPAAPVVATEGDGYLYRGVHEGHPGTANALEGRAEPWGGHSDPALHNGGVNQSEFTSWTRDPGIAFDCATECNGPGVVLRIPDADGAGFTRVPSPDIYGESEVLIRGPVSGADVYDGWDFGELWGFNGQR